MKKLIATLIVMAVMFGGVPVFAANIEMLDELTLGLKVQSQDLILKSKHIDIGAEIGAFDIHNGDAAKDSFYAMGVITVKGFSLFDLSK